MGSYLSTPVTKKISSDEVSDKLKCGASSMQGWRVSQEVCLFFVIKQYYFTIQICNSFRMHIIVY